MNLRIIIFRKEKSSHRMSINIADFVNEDDLPDLSSATDLCAKYHVRDWLGRYCLIFKVIFPKTRQTRFYVLLFIKDFSFMMLEDRSVKALVICWVLSSILNGCLCTHNNVQTEKCYVP